MMINSQHRDEVRLTTDRHLFHKNILRYDPKRKFKTLYDMHNHILQSALELVGSNDLLVFMGDLAFGRVNEVGEFLDKMSHIPKIWIRGNHDNSNMIKRLKHHFIDVCDTLIIDGKYHVNHYPPGLDNQTQTINYEIEDDMIYIHGHTHKPGRQYYGYDISYDGTKLFYNYNQIRNEEI